MRYKRKVLFIFVTTAIGLGIVKIVFSTAFTTSGIDLSQLQYEKKAIEKENLLLGEDLYQRSALTTIAQEAKDDGFSENTKSRITISKSSAVAIR